eukprot:TRINITY_DN10394_c1_g2_i1.p1 TRINITY_DN10394_c1_g2~~TRINITY_DN10394_c1_g2_i1.p1  ORF type:complete len:256 (+),score=55.07 TRINITY_DN10394_c1_g2_i1:73-768(+)
MAKKKKKRPPPEEGPPDASLNEINEVLLGKSKTSLNKSGSLVKKSQFSKPEKTQSKKAKNAKREVNVNFNVAKLTMELLEASVTQLVRRKGLFRDVRLRRSADAFMRSSQLYQKASTHLNSSGNDAVVRVLTKPSSEEVAAFEKALGEHLDSLKGKLGCAAMNAKRNISLAAGGPGKIIGEKLKGLKARATELEKKPRSVIKTGLEKRRKGKKALKGSTAKEGKAAGSDDE